MKGYNDTCDKKKAYQQKKHTCKQQPLKRENKDNIKAITSQNKDTIIKGDDSTSPIIHTKEMIGDTNAQTCFPSQISNTTLEDFQTSWQTRKRKIL